VFSIAFTCFWPEQDAALLDAMLLGEKSFVERPDRIDCRRTRTYHTLIIGGLRIGIVAMFLMWFFRRVGLVPWVCSVLTILFMLTYAALTREDSPVWRAALMIAV
jgi:competence protein ComEC